MSTVIAVIDFEQGMWELIVTRWVPEEANSEPVSGVQDVYEGGLLGSVFIGKR